MKYPAARWIPPAQRLAIIAHDLSMTAVCWIALFEIRQMIGGDGVDWSYWSPGMALILVAQGLVFRWTGLYRGLWRFASLPDLINIAKASAVGLLAIILLLFLYNRLDQVPRSVLVLYPVMLTLLLGIPRLAYRICKDHGFSLFNPKSQQRVLILGAGKTGEMLARELHRNGDYHLVGFLDDAPNLNGRNLQGVPVLGSTRDVGRIAAQKMAELLVIAIPSLPPGEMRRLVELCEQTKLTLRTVPRLHEQIRNVPFELKEIRIEDLLGRPPIIPDWDAMASWLRGSVVLITGAGGSIGSELARQCARHGARALVLVEFNEFSLVTIERELIRDWPEVEILSMLGDCGDPAAMRHALTLAHVDAVLHAAAYKHVPVLEAQLREGVRNNVLATETAAREASAAGVRTFVLISTDKAVDPGNVLGATKRLAEMVCQAVLRHSKTRLLTVRFGNVLDSAGSVVPLFREQIRSGGPVTVTDPDVTRYFMTIGEACQLILQAVAIDTEHEALYTLDMGEPVQIRLLAEQMIRLAGKQPGRDIEIVYTGLRSGEKLHETLFHADEPYRPTNHPKILQAPTRKVDVEAVLDILTRMHKAARAYDVNALSAQLRVAVPEFKPLSSQRLSGSATIVTFPSPAAALPPAAQQSLPFIPRIKSHDPTHP